MEASDQVIAARVRAVSGVSADRGGPSDKKVAAAVRGFAQKFDFWFSDFLATRALPKYRSNIVARINPFIRPIDCHGLDAPRTADRIVEDYVRRNFVTAGGWALEDLARLASPTAYKGPTPGVDLERHDHDDDTHYFYVMKSGPITRNSDILAALKRHTREAQGRVSQARDQTRAVPNYVVAYGKPNTTFKDGIRRPSSAQFWSEIMDLPEEDAIALLAAIAAEAPNHMRLADAERHTAALKLLVAEYIAEPYTGESASDDVDWEFIAKRNMLPRREWKEEDRARHTRATNALARSGYCAAVPDEEPREAHPTDLSLLDDPAAGADG